MSALQPKQRVGLMTSGGLAPCLSAAVGFLIDRYNTIDPTIEILCYRAGYKGLLTGDSFVVDAAGRASALELVKHGGSPIGNSRVKLTNIDECEKKGFVRKGELPLAVAAKQLVADGVTILHTIGGDDTNTQAAELAKCVPLPPLPPLPPLSRRPLTTPLQVLGRQRLQADRRGAAEDHRQ